MKWILASLHVGAVAAVVVGGMSAWEEIVLQRYSRHGLTGLVARGVCDEINAIAPLFLGLALMAGLLLYTLTRRVAALRTRTAPAPVKFGLLLTAALGWPAVVLWAGLNIVGLAAPSGSSVLLISVDTLRADHLGSYGYSRDTSPNLDELAAKGMLFESAYSNSPWTKASVGTLLTGRYPESHGALNRGRFLSPRITTAFELFANRGYRTLFFNGGNPFITDSAAFDQGVDVYRFRTYATRDIEPLEESTPLLIEDALAELTRFPEGTFFAYVHLMDPHLPYTVHSDNHRYTAPQEGQFRPGNFRMPAVRGNDLSAATRDHIIGLYDGQIRHVDEQIGRLLDGLRRTGQLARTIVIVTSDHGEEFWEHGNFEHGHTLYRELLHVPLIISGPGLSPQRVTTSVQQVDLLPTLLELTGVDPGAVRMAGRSFADLLRGEPGEPRPLFASSTIYGSEKYSLATNGYKIIENTGGREKWTLLGARSAQEWELYDLVADPGERHDLGGAEGSRALLTQLMRQLEEMKREARNVR